MAKRNPKASQATARIIPILLFAYAIYASYVVVGPLCVDYLLLYDHDGAGPAAAILTIHFNLLLPLVATLIRLQIVFSHDPGYVPQGSKQPKPGGPEEGTPPGLEAFWKRDAFICDPNGLPIWCSYCNAWKPDRTHHCSDVERCARKMDHFCAWVGGVVGETSLKFFIQFLGYATLWTTFLLITFAYYVATVERNAQWIVVMGFAAFFLLFTSIMFGQTMYQACINITTVEKTASIGGSRPIFMAVLLPPHFEESPPQQTKSCLVWRCVVKYPMDRTFVVLEVPGNLNSWDAGPRQNLLQVFGRNPTKWFVPLEHPPYWPHNPNAPEYPLGTRLTEELQKLGIR